MAQEDFIVHSSFSSTHWGWDKMAAILQTTVSSAFSWMKMCDFRLNIHWSLFIRGQLTLFQHWFRWWLGADQTSSQYLNQWWLNYRSIYASLGLNELRWVTTKKQKWCQFLENLHKYSLKYIGFNHAKQIMGYHACFWDILTNITHEIETKPHIITHLG